jgi:hypothetical protein
MERDELSGSIFDADNHFYEPREALTQFLPDRYRNAIRYVDIEGRTKVAVLGQISDYIPNPTFDRVADAGRPRGLLPVRKPQRSVPAGDHGEGDRAPFRFPRAGAPDTADGRAGH